MLKYLRFLLFPLALLYGMVVLLRNKLYDWGVFKSVKFDLPVICVGNVVVGGAGKTPTTEYLVNLLAGYKVAILSRGYGRKTKGFVLADAQATASSIGDEPITTQVAEGEDERAGRWRGTGKTECGIHI